MELEPGVEQSGTPGIEAFAIEAPDKGRRILPVLISLRVMKPYWRRAGTPPARRRAIAGTMNSRCR
jgi:hypothetical protein